MNKRTKIICTVGPASASASILESMMRAGMDVARLNFSHATYADHKRLIRAIRTASKKAGVHVPLLGDLQGPKIRLGQLPEAGVELMNGSEIILTTATNRYTEGFIPVTYKNLHKDLKKGDRMLIDDGILELHVREINGKQIRALIVNGGTVTSHKGMNFPDSTLHVSAFTKKDREDTLFAIEQGVEWIALSFVTGPKEILLLKRLIKQHTPKGIAPARVIVKIEKHEAINRFDEILSVTDAVMIARGDLGVEINAQEVPLRQKEIIEKCRQAGKPVVVATQMLDSMIRNPRPTRAEVSDVANAVFDHTDAVMLSGESATGKFPLKAVKMMASIIKEAEASVFDDVPLFLDISQEPVTASSQSIKLLTIEGSIHGVLASHTLAPWSEMALKTRPEVPMFIAVSSEREARQLTIRWGVHPFVLKKQQEKTFVRLGLQKLKKDRMVKKNMRLAVILGKQHGEGFDLVTVA
ncbi:pyruvate kinase [Candidatus Uhrbacteria bacterium]|nr:pyruvate kinase [Candidatus Uhrbacteria bacterium]